MYEWSLVAEGGAVSEICVSNRLSGKKKNNNNNNNKDSTEIRKTIKDSNVLESFNNKDSTEIRKTIKDSNVLESFKNLLIIRIVPKFEKQ